MKLKRLQELDVRGKRVLVRVDYNVPLDGARVTDATRVRETLPTLRHLREAGARIVLISHLGRPDGKPEAKYSLRPVAAELEKLSGASVRFAQDCVGEAASSVVEALKPGEIALLENLRFHAGEEANDEEFAGRLAKLGEVFVQDAFGALHRAHASTAGVPRMLPGGIGFLVQKELEFLDRVIGNPVRPFLAILGGAKVSDKIKVMLRLLDRVDTMVIGGAMAYTFLHAQGVSTGRSKVEKSRSGDAQRVIEKAYAKSIECLLPADHVMVEKIEAGAATRLSQGMAIHQDYYAVDIGPRSVALFKEKIEEAKTIFWNGPMGIFELEPFDKGSLAIAEALAEATDKGATSIVGGGDSLALIAKAGVRARVTHCSTGGGASLELLEGKSLPGLSALAG